MSQSIEKLALDLQSQVKTLAEEKSTYTERMRKMEDAMEAYRAKCDQMEATMKEYNDKMAGLVKAMEEMDKDEEEDSAEGEDDKVVVSENLEVPTPEPVSKKANELGGVNEEVMSEGMPKRERVREGGHATETAPTTKAEEPKVEAKAEEVAAPAPVAEAAPAPTPVAAAPVAEPVAAEVKPQPKAEAPAAPAISPELLAKIAEVDALKAALAAEVEARKEALASVSKVKGEFESLSERIAKVEKDDMKAEKVIAKKVAEMAVEPVAAAVATESAEKTPEQIVAEFNHLAQTDSKSARKFYLANEEVIRTYSFGKKAKKA